MANAWPLLRQAHQSLGGLMRNRILCFALSAVTVSNSYALELYTGLNDFRYVKSGIDSRKCGEEVWEAGTYFRTTKQNDSHLFSNGDTLTVKLKALRFPFVPETVLRYKQAKVSQVGLFAEVALKGDQVSGPGESGIPGRLVFYSKDYQPGQIKIPESNTNIFGPVDYSGGGLSLKLTALEFDLDTKDKLTDELLKGVADLGVKASGGIPGYLQGPLVSLSQAAVNSMKSSDDLFAYQNIIFDDQNGAGNPITTPLRTGDLVLIRASNRHQSIQWDDLCFDPSNGSVTSKFSKEITLSDDQTKRVVPEEISDGYVTISILKNAGADAGHIKDSISYQTFVQKLNGEASAQPLLAGLKEATGALQERLFVKEVERHLRVLEMDSGSISKKDRFDSRFKIAAIIQSSEYFSQGFDTATISKSPKCAYLESERLQPKELTKLFYRIQVGSLGLSRSETNSLLTQPRDCNAAYSSLEQLIALIEGKEEKTTP
jgi:hypothetical protein